MVYQSIYRSLRAAGVCTYFATLTLSLNLLQVASMPFYILAPVSVLRFNSLLASLVWRQMISLFERDGGKIIYTSGKSQKHPSDKDLSDSSKRRKENQNLNVPCNDITGDVIPCEESAIVISNHSSFTDFYLLLSLARKKRMLAASKYFAKESLKYMPIFGWGLWLMGMILIKRNWTNDKVGSLLTANSQESIASSPESSILESQFGSLHIAKGLGSRDLN
jgi:hypothetical protein